MQLRIYRCRICGEAYLGYSAPENCPFCGAHAEFLETPDVYSPEIDDVQLTEAERADLESSIVLETGNCRFYLGMAQRKDNDALRSTYKRLAKVEAEHCEVFCNILKVDKPADLMVPGETTGSWASDIEDSLVRENRASDLYRTFAGRATNERLKEVWSAISDVETDHITLDELAKTYM
ncbi:MAG: hypothetical protein RBS17_08670 [Coriobacteriia bacterium]|nr:hypothetical protein [Coriobacteriia bacterium]